MTINGNAVDAADGLLSGTGGTVNTCTAQAGMAGMSSNPVPIAARLIDGRKVLHLLSNIEVVDAALGRFKPFAEAWCPNDPGKMIVPDSARVVIW